MEPETIVRQALQALSDINIEHAMALMSPNIKVYINDTVAIEGANQAGAAFAEIFREERITAFIIQAVRGEVDKTEVLVKECHIWSWKSLVSAPFVIKIWLIGSYFVLSDRISEIRCLAVSVPFSKGIIVGETEWILPLDNRQGHVSG